MYRIVVLLFACLFSFASDSTLEVKKSKDSGFVLKVTDKQKKIIREIIFTMANNNPILLGFKKKQLERLGKKLNGLGPLQFLGYVGSSKDLKVALKKVSKSSLKWKGFVKGMSKGLNKIVDKKSFPEDLIGFSKLVQVDVKTLRLHANKRDWNGFILSLT